MLLWIDILEYHLLFCPIYVICAFVVVCVPICICLNRYSVKKHYRFKWLIHAVINFNWDFSYLDEGTSFEPEYITQITILISNNLALSDWFINMYIESLFSYHSPYIKNWHSIARLRDYGKFWVSCKFTVWSIRSIIILYAIMQFSYIEQCYNPLNFHLHHSNSNSEKNVMQRRW